MSDNVNPDTAPPPEVSECVHEVLELMDGVTRALYDQFIPERIWGVYHRLTLYVMELVLEHAHGTINEFAVGRPHSAMVLFRSAFEGVVRLMDWYGDESKALRDWDRLPIAAHDEEKRKARGGLAENVALGVRRDYQAYVAAHPELAESDKEKDEFRKAAERVFVGRGVMTDDQFRIYYGVRYGIPSLFAHARVLGIEDFFEVTDTHWVRMVESRKSDPNHWTMNLAAMLLDLCSEVVARYGLNSKPVGDVGRQWDAALAALHQAEKTAPVKPF